MTFPSCRSGCVQRLDLEDVQGGAAEPPWSSASTRAASSTTGPRAVLTRIAVGFIREPPGVDQVARLLRQEDVQRDDVGLAQELLEDTRRTPSAAAVSAAT